MIRTKILATVGPKCGDEKTLRRLADAGCDAFRINFSHGTDEQREIFLDAIRKVEQEIHRPLAVVGDLCGPKIRVGMISGGSVLLAEGQLLDIVREPLEGNATHISTTLPELIDTAKEGDPILLDDGKIQLEVESTQGRDNLTCRVKTDGILSSGKGVNLPSTDLPVSAITEKDRRDAAWIAKHDIDYVALSFVQRGGDVNELRELLDKEGCEAQIIAKIEKPCAVRSLDEILEIADAVMVARGDLGVEMQLAAVPVTQKRIARLAQQAGKPCIIATQMLESMTQSPTPTRAEVSDVANAVLDHADAVMLSGETAVGKYPVQTVSMMNDIAESVQSYHDEHLLQTPVEFSSAPTSAALAIAVREILCNEEIAAVAVFTATGATARILAKNRLSRPILGLAPTKNVVRRMCLYYGVESLQAETPQHTRDVLSIAERFAKDQGVAQTGQKIIVLSGRPLGKPGCTNTIVVHTVG